MAHRKPVQLLKVRFANNQVMTCEVHNNEWLTSAVGLSTKFVWVNIMSPASVKRRRKFTNQP